jgi:hypothetical protein
MVIYTNPRYITVSYDERNQVVLFDWTNFAISLADIQELHAKALDTARKHQCYYYIAETSKVRTALSQEIIQWWGQTWVPTLVKAGLQAIVTVVPSSAIANLSTKSWQTQVVDGITMKNVTTLQEAIAFTNSLRT